MTLIDDIRKDREAGTPGEWRVLDGKHSLQIHSEKHWIANIKCESCPAHEDANARRIARVPEMEAALIAADEALQKADALVALVAEALNDYKIDNEYVQIEAVEIYTKSREATK